LPSIGFIYDLTRGAHAGPHRQHNPNQPKQSAQRHQRDDDGEEHYGGQRLLLGCLKGLTAGEPFIFEDLLKLGVVLRDEDVAHLTGGGIKLRLGLTFGTAQQALF
jgi:hypothetical protein